MVHPGVNFVFVVVPTAFFFFWGGEEYLTYGGIVIGFYGKFSGEAPGPIFRPLLYC